MRNFKIFLWIFIIFLVQTVILARVHIINAVPSIVIGYITCVMMLENEFRDAAVIGIICSALAGALCGRSFEAVTLFYTYSAILMFSLRAKPRYMGAFVKSLLWTFVISALSEILIFALGTMTVTADMLITCALPTAVINTMLTAVIYPLIKRTMYKEEKKKLLIV